MPVYQLPDDFVFPPPEEAEPNGLLAIGGDLSLKRLLLAYSMGIFPWYAAGDPILWWSPSPRLVLQPSQLKVTKSLKRVINKKIFTVTMDQAFDRIMQKCATVKRRTEKGTWIVEDMIKAYTRLHRTGFAHSVETWENEKLAGGLYGVSLGKVFFGESMFAEKRDASKVALVYLVSALHSWGIDLIDCQVTTPHLMRFGAREIPRSEFLLLLDEALKHATHRGSWILSENVKLLI